MSSGLLGMMGGFDDPKTLGLLGMAAPLLQAGGYSQTPVSLGQALGAGMQGGVQGYQSGVHARQMAAMRDMQMKQAQRESDNADKLDAGMSALFSSPESLQSLGMPPQAVAYLSKLPAPQQASFVSQYMARENDPSKYIKEVNGTLVDLRTMKPVMTVPKRGEIPWNVTGDEAGGYRMAPGAASAIEQAAGARERGEMPYKLVPYQPGGGVATGAALMASPEAPAGSGATVGGGANPNRQIPGVLQFPATPDVANNPLLRSLGEKSATKVFDDADTASKNAELIRSGNRARELLDSGIISGTGANARTEIEKAFQTAGLVDGKRVANTEAFMSEMGRQTLSLVKQLGAGSGISNADRDFADKVAGGNIALSEQSIRKMLDISERVSRASLAKYGDQIKPLLEDPNVPEYTKRALRVDAPDPYQAKKAEAPSGPPKVSSRADYDALPAGSQYVDPNGVLRTKVR